MIRRKFLCTPRRWRLAGAERGLPTCSPRVSQGYPRVSQGYLNPSCDRVRAPEHAPRGRCRVLKRRHCLAEIVERGATTTPRARSSPSRRTTISPSITYPYDRVRGGSGGRGSRVSGGRVRFSSASLARTRASWCAARASTYSSRNVGRSHLPSCHRSRTARDLCGTQMSGAPRHRRDSLDAASDVWSHSRARAS